MKIKIVTTEKRLTKSIVNQMPIADESVIRLGEPLGYLLNIRKDTYKVVLIYWEENYYVSYTNWVKLNHSVYRKIGRWSKTLKFETEEECDLWWERYMDMKMKAHTQIYI